MTLTETFIAELNQEAAATRKLLERVPEEQYSWKPHPKSLSIGQLAWHLAVLPLGITDLVSEREREPPTVPRPEPKSRAELLEVFEKSLASANEKLAGWGDEGLGESFRLVRGGQTIIELPRAGMIRTILLNHWYHHRGQMTVYLRLLDVPLPGIYGPTADEPMMPIERGSAAPRKP